MNTDPKMKSYWEAVRQIDERRMPEIENHGKAAYEYGVLVQKHLFYLYGGSLILIPPLLQASSNFSISEAFFSAAWLFSSIILLNICTYIVHLNWNFNLSSSQNDRGIDYWEALVQIWGTSDENQKIIDDLRKRKASLAKKIIWTLYLPHFFGIASLCAYAVGGSLMIFAVSNE